MASQARSVDNTISSEWMNPDYAFIEDDLCTTAALNLDINVYNIINTPFTIPAGATIDGIEVKTVRATDVNDEYTIELQDKDPAWRLKTGTPYLAVCADAAPETLGSPADDWAGSWDAAHINSSSFQIRLQYHKIAKANTPGVDHIEVVIYYTEGEGQEYFKTLAETSNLTDSVLKQQTLSRAHAESINLSDNILKKIAKKISETVNLSDSVLRRSSFVRTPTETVTLSDSILDALTFLRSFAETLALTDTVISTKLYTKTLAETLNLTDVTIRAWASQIALTETATLSDSIIKSAGKLLEEILILTDVLTKTYIPEVIAKEEAGEAAYTKILTEIIIASDTLVRKLTLQRVLTEIVPLSDAFLISRYLVLTETLILTDVIHGAGKDIAATVELPLMMKKMILDMCKKTDELAFLTKEMILKRRV